MRVLSLCAATQQDGSVPKLKVTLKVTLHGVTAVTEVQAIEEIVEPVAPAPEKPAAEAMDTDAAADGEKPAAAEVDAAAAEPEVRKSPHTNPDTGRHAAF
jgi:hypothetical protein